MAFLYESGNRTGIKETAYRIWYIFLSIHRLGEGWNLFGEIRGTSQKKQLSICAVSEFFPIDFEDMQNAGNTVYFLDIRFSNPYQRPFFYEKFLEHGFQDNSVMWLLALTPNLEVDELQIQPAGHYHDVFPEGKKRETVLKFSVADSAPCSVTEQVV